MRKSYELKNIGKIVCEFSDVRHCESDLIFLYISVLAAIPAVVRVTWLVGLAILEEEALVLLVGHGHLRPELAVLLQPALHVAREVVLGVKVVDIQNVLSLRWADVVGRVARWQRVGHGRVVGTCKESTDIYPERDHP